MAVVVNLDSLVGKAIHTPKVDGSVLYVRVDGEEEGKINKTEKWVKASESTYNSPTNIRKVFLTETKAVINFYKPIVVKGKSSGTLWKEIRYVSEYSLRDVVEHIINRDYLWHEYTRRVRSGEKVEKPEEFSLRGTGLKALNSPWVASNIEEIYIDINYLYSETYLNGAIEDYGRVMKAYREYRKLFKKSEIPLRMFLLALGIDRSKLREKFGRLKGIYILDNLDRVLEGEYKGNQGEQSLKELSGSWWKDNSQIIKSNSNIFISSLLYNDIPRYNRKFHLRSGTYKFDDEVLKDYFNSLEKQKIEEPITSVISESVEKVADEKEEKLGDIEEFLVKLEECQGLGVVKKTLFITFNGKGKNEIERILSKFTVKNREKYRRLMSGGEG